MIDIINGLYTKFTELTNGAHNTFYNDISGRLYRELANQGTTLPYAVFHVIDQVPDITFDTNFETVRIQFDLISDSESDSEIEDMYTHLKDLYDWAELSISGYRHLEMKRELAKFSRDQETGYWVYNVDYLIYVEESNSPSLSPSKSPSPSPSLSPSASLSPSRSPSASPSNSPSASPS